MVRIVDKAHLGLATASDGIKIIVFMTTMILLAIRFYKSDKYNQRNISRSVPIQLVLILTSTIFYLTNDILQITEVQKDFLPGKRQNHSAEFITFLTGQQLFLIQTFLYVGMYTKVALLLPLMLQLPDPQNTKKQVRRSNLVFWLEVLFAALLTA